MSKAYATSRWSWEKEKTTEGELHGGGFKYPPGVDPQVAGLFWVRYGEGSPRELLLSMLSAGFWNEATELEIPNAFYDGLKLSTYRFFSGIYSHLTMEEISARQVPIPFKEAVFSI